MNKFVKNRTQIQDDYCQKENKVLKILVHPELFDHLVEDGLLTLRIDSNDLPIDINGDKNILRPFDMMPNIYYYFDQFFHIFEPQSQDYKFLFQIHYFFGDFSVSETKYSFGDEYPVLSYVFPDILIEEANEELVQAANIKLLKSNNADSLRKEFETLREMVRRKDYTTIHNEKSINHNLKIQCFQDDVERGLETEPNITFVNINVNTTAVNQSLERHNNLKKYENCQFKKTITTQDSCIAKTNKKRSFYIPGTCETLSFSSEDESIITSIDIRKFVNFVENKQDRSIWFFEVWFDIKTSLGNDEVNRPKKINFVNAVYNNLQKSNLEERVYKTIEFLTKP
jgi:hypothetical protein